ncbi:MAG: alanine--tRNA ligase [Pseudomonadota bacterium]
MTALQKIRSDFLSFFTGLEGLSHEIVPSAPLIPQNDPTLLFVNAGMVPFKNIFTGMETRNYQRATSSQKCVRAGGKHNDLDNVGYTARHHTFFEMLGNFSFGDYFKEAAIHNAWTLLTQHFGLPADRLLVTVYHTDDEAFSLWRKISGLPEERIIRITTNDNFWSMGDTGPCGPCSEIFYDHGPDIPGGPPGSPEEDGDRFIEIWNLVFMQYETLADGQRVDLPKPSIDTGMGLERIAAVLQGVHDNYDIDLFRTLITASEAITSAPSGASANAAIAHRVIADHLRSAAFMIADGVSPSNEGRGYVLRRIMRRAMRYAHSLGRTEPLLARLAPTLIDEMGGAFPELERARALLIQTLTGEEEKFAGLLDRGMKLLRTEIDHLGAGRVLTGTAAFKLYDTYGFPLDLTQDALRREGLDVDVEGFEQAMADQKKAARAAWSGSGDLADEKIWLDLAATHGATDFLGYTHTEAQGVILAILENGTPVDYVAKDGNASGAEGSSVNASSDNTSAAQRSNFEILTNQTPFYAESGGQIGDTGTLVSEAGTEVSVIDTAKRGGGLHLHKIAKPKGPLRVGDVVTLQVDGARRDRIRANHSATHLLHASLRHILGTHVTQKGSLVTEDRLRFDFSHPNPLTPEERTQIDAQVNAVIRQNTPTQTRVMPYDDAVEAGAMALFGEKYDDDVRVLSMGEDPADLAQTFSVELCGGIHVQQTGDIALFKIVSEGAVSAGIRRVEALTGETARQYLEEQASLAQNAADVLKTPIADLPGRVAALAQERKKLEQQLSEAKKALAMAGGGTTTDAGNAVKTVGSVNFLGRVFHDIPAKDLRGMIDDAKKSMRSGVVAMVGVNEGKAAIAVGVTDDLTDQLSAVEMVRMGAAAMGGKGGGGRADMAQAGGPDGSRADEALHQIKDYLERAAS